MRARRLTWTGPVHRCAVASAVAGVRRAGNGPSLSAIVHASLTGLAAEALLHLVALLLSSSASYARELRSRSFPLNLTLRATALSMNSEHGSALRGRQPSPFRRKFKW